MKPRPHFRLLYFDGFAGSGSIDLQEGGDDFDPSQHALAFGESAVGNSESLAAEETAQFEFTAGVAMQVLGISEPRPFDIYYFVEKMATNADILRTSLNDAFPYKNAHVVQADCNDELIKLASHLRKPRQKDIRTLAFLDPYGMQLRWNALSALRGLPVDVWILVPTGMGIVRLLRNDHQIEPSWMNRLKEFLGMQEDEIIAHFYRRETAHTLFGESSTLLKEPQAATRAAQLYRKRILDAELFKYVSEPLALKNAGRTLYHFILCTNSAVALKIANDISK